MVLRVAGCAGHAGFGVTAGKRTPAGEYEWDFNNKVILAFEEALKQYEDVVFLRTDDRTGRKDISLDDRVDKANRWGADLYISFHHNAYLARWGTWTGTETYTNLGSWPDAERLAGYVHSRLVEAYGLKDRGLKKANFQILRETKMPSILVEGGYMDSTIDIKKLRDDKVLSAAGYAAAAGVAKYAGLKQKATAKPPTKPVVQKPAVKPKEEKIVEDGVYWDGKKMAKGQIGRVIILKSLPLWSPEKKKYRGLSVGDVITVYRINENDNYKYEVGGGYTVSNVEGYVKYEQAPGDLIGANNAFYQ